MGKKGTKDLTVGNPLKVIISFMLPIFFGILFQSFYSLVDSIIVGQTLGKDALAAVGATNSVTFLIIGFCNGTASGFSIPVAQRFGAKDENGVQKFIANSIRLSIVVSAIVTVAVCFLCMQILEMMHTPDNIIKAAYAYLIVIFAGIPFTFFYNLFSGIIRAMGDSKTPVIMLVLGSAINIVLDLFFIIVLGTGVEGAAYSTVISQLIAMIGCIIALINKFNILQISKENRRSDAQCKKTLLYMGMPMGLQYSVTAIGSVILQVAINGLGSDHVAAFTAGCKIGMFVCAMYEALGGTMATYGGQNLGQRDWTGFLEVCVMAYWLVLLIRFLYVFSLIFLLINWYYYFWMQMKHKLFIMQPCF